MSGATSGLTGRATNPAGVAAGPITPWKKSSGRFSTNENLRFFRTLRVRDRIPALCLPAVEKVLRTFFHG
jgi:hypothetical protein